MFVYRNTKMSSRTSEATKNVAVKEEPADRGYGEPISVTSIPTSTAQDTRNSKKSMICWTNGTYNSIDNILSSLSGAVWNNEISEPMIPSFRTCTVTNLLTIDPRGALLPYRSHK